MRMIASKVFSPCCNAVVAILPSGDRLYTGRTMGTPTIQTGKNSGVEHGELAKTDIYII